MVERVAIEVTIGTMILRCEVEVVQSGWRNFDKTRGRWK